MPKTVHGAVFGRLIPAIICVLARKVTGINANKLKHIFGKAEHLMDKLEPAEIVYEITSVVVKNCATSGRAWVYIPLICGKIVCITVKVLQGGAVGVGTAYVIEKIADELDRF
jgi:hypothetical protein